MLKRVGPNRYVVMDAEGKRRLSKPMSRARAAKRLQEIEYFKHRGARGNA